MTQEVDRCKWEWKTESGNITMVFYGLLTLLVLLRFCNIYQYRTKNDNFRRIFRIFVMMLLVCVVRLG